MATDGPSLKSLSATLSRVELKFESINIQFEELDEAAARISDRLEKHRSTLDQQVHQHQVWVSLLEDQLTTLETNLFVTYAMDTLRRCHSVVLGKLPDLAPSLPTVASVLHRKARNRQVRLAWESSLQDLGLRSTDITALCALFVMHGCQAEYFGPAQRQHYTGQVEALIQRVVTNLALREGLLRAVQVVEVGHADTVMSEAFEQ
ncbi:single-pass membrane and coiled-coil domain-containing protein 1-like isoform X2 [Brienomyrus brachyistius]|uniref:single-pass membrane and coiled-coil domain-containing protein 1-like isoform X1 n=1 Tax=Brienomyrus brachyistius TaxID=42636 RepID=UPI0020B33223|nr:single-pass membrane and coiled-coil domain-containing protein 1-like isoform X1 [Brienomyrus brachyistius]XP_048836191.1 single-pass membrane and coiled-coil domain-containing protein 1-like isoform X2 [Brienomyrus brachyistius]